MFCHYTNDYIPRVRAFIQIVSNTQWTQRTLVIKIHLDVRIKLTFRIKILLLSSYAMSLLRCSVAIILILGTYHFIFSVIISVNKWTSVAGLKLRSVDKLMIIWTSDKYGITAKNIHHGKLRPQPPTRLPASPQNQIIFQVYCFHHYGLLASWKHEHVGLTKCEKRQPGWQINRQRDRQKGLTGVQSCRLYIL